MKKPNHVTYYGALMLWELYILSFVGGNIITSPVWHLCAFLYDRCGWIRKILLEKHGLPSSTSSEDYLNWCKEQEIRFFGKYGNPVDSYFADTSMASLCTFFVNSTILVISNCIFGFNPPKDIEQPYGLYALFIVLGIGLLLYFYIISKKNFYFKQFDKWKQPKRRKMQWLAFGLIVAICGYQALTIWLFLT
jgi:hypothetical protein